MFNVDLDKFTKKVSDAIRGSECPYYLTAEEWDEWHDNAEKSHPFRYRLVEKIYPAFIKAIKFPIELIRNAHTYLHNKYVSRVHCFIATPENIKRGQWYDYGNRILPCLFDSFVEFIESEQASSVIWSDRKKYNISYVNARWWRANSQQAGIDNLIWAANQRFNEYNGIYPGDPLYGKPTSQAEIAQWCIDAYYWWKYERPTRPDPMEESGWNEYAKSLDGERKPLHSLLSNNSPEIEKLKQEAHNKLREIEKKHDDEDTKWMIELIQKRESFWS